MYIASESYEEVPEADRAHYLYPYFYPMLDEYDYTQEDMPCYPTSVGFASLATAMADNLSVSPLDSFISRIFFSEM